MPLAIDQEKRCGRCGATYPLVEFSRNRNARDGLQYWCKRCHRAKEHDSYRPTRLAYRRQKAREKYATDEGYRRQLNAFFKYTYGITLETYERMMEAQSGLCAICDQPPSTRRTPSAGRPGRLYVDHDEYGVRGLLCMSCNTALGHFRDDPMLLLRAAKYLYFYSKDQHG